MLHAHLTLIVKLVGRSRENKIADRVGGESEGRCNVSFCFFCFVFSYIIAHSVGAV